MKLERKKLNCVDEIKRIFNRYISENINYAKWRGESKIQNEAKLSLFKFKLYYNSSITTLNVYSSDVPSVVRVLGKLKEVDPLCGGSILNLKRYLEK